jgi:sec-independent protein translocase protein TatC
VTGETTMTFWDHFAELRQRIIKVSIAVVTGAVVAFIFREQLLDLLIQPFCETLPPDEACELFFSRATGAFTVFMRLSLFGGFVLASPVVIFQLWRFISPALSSQEKRYAIPITSIMTLLFLSGVALGYWSLRRGLEFLLGFGGDNLQELLNADDYLSFTLRFIAVFGVAFLFPVFLFAAAAVGVVGSAKLREGRRWAVTLIVVIGAVVTPSGDPLTLMLLSTPLYILYELTILAIRFVLRK